MGRRECARVGDNTPHLAGEKPRLPSAAVYRPLTAQERADKRDWRSAVWEELELRWQKGKCCVHFTVSIMGCQSNAVLTSLVKYRLILGFHLKGQI